MGYFDDYQTKRYAATGNRPRGAAGKTGSAGGGLDYEELLRELFSLSSSGPGLGTYAAGKGLDLAGGLLKSVFGAGAGERKAAKGDLATAKTNLLEHRGEDVFDPKAASAFALKGTYGPKKKAAAAMQDISGNVNALDIMGALKEGEFDMMDNIFAANYVRNKEMVAARDLTIDQTLMDAAIKRFVSAQAMG
jgi:hypothetical protein